MSTPEFESRTPATSDAPVAAPPRLRLVADNTGRSLGPGAPLPPEAELSILIDATGSVVGEVSKVYQAMRRAVEGGSGVDLLGAARAFDGLPIWQRERIMALAVERAIARIG
jgi:hypothetical protein